MKYILFDLTATQPNMSGKRHGGGKYGEIILRRIIERKLPIFCYYDSFRWLNPEIHSLIIKNQIQLFDINKIPLKKIVKENRIDTIYSVLPDINLKNFDECNVIGTIHGLREIETPLDSFFWKYRNIKFKERIKFLIRNIIPFIGYLKARKAYTSFIKNPNFKIVTVSNHSYYAFKSYFPQTKGIEIPVYYSPPTITNQICQYKYSEPYYLLVSGNRWEKNNLRAIIAFDKLFSMGYLQKYHVRITGAKDNSIFKYKIKNPQKFIFTGYIDDIELDQLYHDAYCLIYPSLNEGFGYPPLEAMHYGIPVIASPFTSIPEICEGAVIYINPFSIEEIMNRILFITNNDIHKKYSSLSRQQFNKVDKKQSSDLDLLINYIYKDSSIL